MAKEILAVPEESLRDVIKVIRAGLGEADDEATAEMLTEWCDSEEAYLDDEAEEAE